MIEKIGTNAGSIWNALTNGAMDVKALKKATKLKDKELYAALGWLAREGKVTFCEADGELTVELI